MHRSSAIAASEPFRPGEFPGGPLRRVDLALAAGDLSPVHVGFVGTVVACEARVTSSVKRAFVVGEPWANWILTIDIESADLDAPAGIGTRASFLIHSPALTLCVGDSALGRRFRFEIERRTVTGQIHWSRFSGREIA